MYWRKFFVPSVVGHYIYWRKSIAPSVKGILYTLSYWDFFAPSTVGYSLYVLKKVFAPSVVGHYISWRKSFAPSVKGILYTLSYWDFFTPSVVRIFYAFRWGIFPYPQFWKSLTLHVPVTWGSSNTSSVMGIFYPSIIGNFFTLSCGDLFTPSVVWQLNHKFERSLILFFYVSLMCQHSLA